MTEPSPTVGRAATYAGKRALVIGGCGFMGLNLARALVALGADVTIFDVAAHPDRLAFAGLDGHARIVLGTVTDDAAVARAVVGQDIVFNLAGRSGAVDSLADPFLDLEVNARGALTALEACRRHNPQAKVVFPGSRLQFGRPRYLPVDEEHPLDPIDLYGIHKLTAEKYHALYHRLFGLDTTVLRISNPYGPWQYVVGGSYNIANWFIYLAVCDRPLTLFGSGEQLRDHIFVADVVSAFLLAGASPRAAGAVFNVGSGQPASLAHVANRITAVVGRGSVESVPWPPDSRLTETGDYVTNTAKIEAALGWKSAVSLDDGIRQTAAFYEAALKQGLIDARVSERNDPHR